MSSYFDVKNVPAIDNALDFPDDVKADDGKGGTKGEKDARGRKRKLDFINAKCFKRACVDVRISADGNRAIIEVEELENFSVPQGLILAGPMSLAEMRVYLTKEATWSTQ
jgi:hypothetical protein